LVLASRVLTIPYAKLLYLSGGLFRQSKKQFEGVLPVIDKLPEMTMFIKNKINFTELIVEERK
jgi:hypothetical protein